MSNPLCGQSQAKCSSNAKNVQAEYKEWVLTSCILRTHQLIFPIFFQKPYGKQIALTKSNINNQELHISKSPSPNQQNP